MLYMITTISKLLIMKTIFTLLAALLLLTPATNASVEPHPSPYFTSQPIHLLAFEARGLDEGVILFWETQEEWQADSYTIERSADGATWQSIGQLEAGGNNTSLRRYVFVDRTPYMGANYYRLVATDYTGDSHVSSYLDMEYDGAFDPAIFPNPVRAAGQLNVRLFGFENQEAQLELIDLNGRRYDRQSFNLAEGENLLPMELPHVSNGLYFVRIFVDDYPVTTYRVLIQEG